MFNTAPMQYDMFRYGTTPSNYYPSTQTQIQMDYNNTAALDQTDRRRRRTGSTSTLAKDKETIPNMHMVSPSFYCSVFILVNLEYRGGVLKIEPLNERLESGKKSTSRGLKSSSKTCTRSTKISCNHTLARPTK